MGEKKRVSKRLPLRKKYKIKKRLAEHNRKVRKAAKKNPSFVQKKLNKAVATRIPNSFPLKGDMLREIQELQHQKMEEKIEQKQAMQKEARAQEFSKKRSLEGNPDLYAYAQKSAQDDLEFTSKESLKNKMLTDILSTTEKKDTSMGAFYHEFRKVVETADVIIEVLDARDPIGCRCTDIENTIAAKYPNKRIVLLLNKIDLVPRQNVEKWMAYLRNSYPTVAFKASTQKKGKISQSKQSFNKASDVDMHNSESLGADALLQLLKHFARTGTVRTSITVGIVGFPNVGKSSVINSLCRIRAAKVGATPGLTKTAQEIHLDKHVKLLDTPGIVFPKTTDVSDDLILRNVVKIEQVDDPISPVATILQRCSKAVMLSIYRIPDFDSVDQFLIHVARKNGKLMKGGIPNINSAAKMVLQDWTGGKIPFYTEPPKVGADVHVGASIVTEFGDSFDVSQAKLLDSIQVLSSHLSTEMHAIPLATQGPLEVEDAFMDHEDAPANEDDSDEEVPALMIASSSQQSKSKTSTSRGLKAVSIEGTTKSKKQDLSDEADQFNPQVNRNKKKQLKQEQKKKQKETKKRTSIAIPITEEGVDADTPYSFASDFGAGEDIDVDDIDVDL